MGKYSIGIDFGTLSARAVLVRLPDGVCVAESEFKYPHAVMGREDFALSPSPDVAYQNPRDYLDALKFTVSEVTRIAEIDREEIVGVGIDFTSCTCLPTLSDGTPLCFLEEFKNDPEAYVKLWKHHGAVREAERITEIARVCDEKMLERYGGRISSEWLFPKLYEILNKSPEVFRTTEKYLEASDWLTYLLTGSDTVSACTAGYKALWNKRDGYPSDDFFAEVDPRLAEAAQRVICRDVRATGTLAGFVCERGAEISSLPVGCAVATPIIDAHSALLSSGVIDDGTLLLVLGTSACHILITRDDKDVPSICGSVEDGVVEGYVAYEAGQTAFGDIFDWFVNNCVPQALFDEAKAKGVDIFTLLGERAETGNSHVLVLDFWNGNRTPYGDDTLSGAIIGMTLNTRPEDIYRGIVEACVFGTQRIVEIYESAGLPIKHIVAAGGISNKNPYLMQTLADALGREIRVSASTQAAAKGAAVFASCVGGAFDTVDAAATALFDGYSAVYSPNFEKYEYYGKLYGAYLEASEYYAKQSDIMRRLKKL